jgi:hypothetical protein
VRVPLGMAPLLPSPPVRPARVGSEPCPVFCLRLLEGLCRPTLPIGNGNSSESDSGSATGRESVSVNVSERGKGNRTEIERGRGNDNASVIESGKERGTRTGVTPKWMLTSLPPVSLIPLVRPIAHQLKMSLMCSGAGERDRLPPPTASGAAATSVGRPTPTPAPKSPPLMLSELDPDTLPRDFKKEGQGWSVVWNPKTKKQLEIAPIHTLVHER